MGRFREFLTDVTGSSFVGETILKVFCSFPGITLSCFRRIRQSQPLSPSRFDEDVFVRNDRKNDEEASVGVRGEDADVSNDGQLVGWWSSGW